MKLQEFLLGNMRGIQEKRILLPAEMLGELPGQAMIRIRSLSANEFTLLCRIIMGLGEEAADRVGFELDDMVAAEHLLMPNIFDAAAIRAAGCATPREYLHALYTREAIEHIASEVLALSGIAEEAPVLRMAAI